MNNVNSIQNAIMQLEGGAFQKLFDAYLYKKYKFNNIQTLGVQTGTNKPTKGTPDSYVLADDGKYILINYGTVSSQSAEKIRADILSCFDTTKLLLPKDKIKKIICGHCSTNIHIEQFNSIMETIDGVEIELIGIDTLSHDLALLYPHIAKDELGIAIDTNQFFEVEDFVKAYDANGINAPINCDFFHRKPEITEICTSILNNRVTVLTGPSGIGKTRLALEACRKQNDGQTKVFCIKSNGNLLYEDIKYYISDPGRYLIFFDDANMVASLENVLGTLLTLSTDFDVRVLISVRDYAKERVIDAVSQYILPNIIEVGRLKDDEIKDILKADLGIVNSDYLNKIAGIANGNIRLAFLAGMRSIDGGYQAIRNAEDIFKNYYGRIIDEAKLTKQDILILFFIAIAGPVKNNENQLYRDMKNLYGGKIVEKDIIENLYSLELVDWFKNEITKITDQSFGNYILYYVLFEKKWVSVESLISVGFSAFRNKIVYALNTLMEIFNSEECTKYIEDSIIAAWDNAPMEQDMEYLESFYQVNLDKALSIIKNHIDQDVNVDFDLHSFDINSKKNYHNIKTKVIEILGGYKYTENFEDAVDLLMLYFEKRPDLIMDFYFVLSERLLYDKYSYRDKYNHEMRLLDRVWCYTEEGKNYNNSILYLQIAEYALKTEISFTEEIRNSRSVNFVRMPLGYTDELADIRTNIWKNLAILRKNEEYRNAINNILSEVHYNGLNEEDVKNYLQSDFNTIYEYVIDKNTPDFYDAKIVTRYKQVAEKIGIRLDDRYMVAERNPKFRIYRMLIREHLIGRTIEEDERLRKESISKEISIYDLKDFQRLFCTCKFLEKTICDREQWSISTGLDCVFEIIEGNIELYLKVLKEYFDANAPLRLNGYRQIRYLLDSIGYEATYCFIKNNVFDKKNVWMSFIWESVPKENINEKIVNDYKTFVFNNLEKDNPIIPTIQVVARYGERDSEIKEAVIKEVLDNPKLSVKFLGDMYHDDGIEEIINFFKNDISALTSIYMSAIEISCEIDYNGKLFAKIFEQQHTIWNEYVDWVKSKDNMCGDEHKVFELVWRDDKWCEYVEYAFKILIDDNRFFYINEFAGLLFAKTTDATILERKKYYLLEKLRENNSEIEKCKKLIDVVVNILPEWKLEYILEFLKVNKKLEDFKKIDLFPSFCSWSGSEIPLIIEKIDFLKLLKDNLKGIDYIDHRKYIEEYRMDLEKYKEKIELREYIENADYA